MKAILEFENVPEFCNDCPLGYNDYSDIVDTRLRCVRIQKDVSAYLYSDRHPDCPLKIIEEKEE